MIMEISKDFEFEAAHSLGHLPHTHKCHRTHGHSYKLRVVCAGEVDPEMAWVIDYADISKVVNTVLTAIDHTNIDILFQPRREKCSDPISFAPSTAENLCLWFWRQLKPSLPMLVAIEIKETASSKVVYRPVPPR